jgi:hypothetical protein
VVSEHHLACDLDTIQVHRVIYSNIIQLLMGNLYGNITTTTSIPHPLSDYDIVLIIKERLQEVSAPSVSGEIKPHQSVQTSV